MNKAINRGLIEKFKDELATNKLSLKQFYKRYIARKNGYIKTSYREFLADLESMGMDCPYISAGINSFFLILKRSCNGPKLPGRFCNTRLRH